MSTSPSEQNWDAIVVGSGLGGLTTACLLAQAGKKTLLLERHTVPGGFTHTFKRRGFEWDVGVHYVGGSIWKRGTILRRMFDYVTNGALEWAPMDDVYDRVILKGERFDYRRGLEAQIQNLSAKFPGEEAAIRRYYKIVRQAAATGPWFFGEKTMPEFLSRTVGWLLRRRYECWARQTARDVIASVTLNKKLQAVLAAQCGDYGLPPAVASFAIHATVVDHYIEGGSYPVGGADKIASTILRVFENYGGRLQLGADVVRVRVEMGRAVGVELKDGSRIDAPVIVSNAGLRNTLNFFPKCPAQLALAQAEANRLAPSTAHICVYLGLDATDDELNLPKHNLWIYDHFDFDDVKIESSPDSIPLVYVSFPSAKDPQRGKKGRGRATIQAIAPCDFEAVRAWADHAWPCREAEYLAFKERWRESVTAKLIAELPQIKGRIVHSEVSTPLSTRHFSNYSHGEIYGLEHTPARFAARSLRPRTRLPGLFLTGQDVVSVGVGGALYSGVLTATAVLNKSVILRILFGWPLRFTPRRPNV